jgi:hypothetical protein
MSLTLSIFLYIYYAILSVWLVFSLVAVYHMFKFGFKNFITFTTTFTYMAISAVILLSSFGYISQVDWQTELFNLQLPESNSTFNK